MRIMNPLRMNDWPIKPFLITVLSVQIIVWAVIGLDFVGWMVPGIRQPVVILYLLFIPGILILRTLRLHGLSNVETLLYSVGLSAATVMLLGVFINFVYPFMGINAPISLQSLAITTSLFVLSLLIFSCVWNRCSSSQTYVNLKAALSPPFLFLCLLPFFSIFGTYLVNFHNTNILLLVLIAIIAFATLLIGFNKFIPSSLYPFAVFVIGLSLLFSRSLISMYITGSDIHEEYFYANTVISEGYWDPTRTGILNSMLSITMFAPVTSLLSGLALTWLFKVIYPLLMALVPLGLYIIFQKQTEDRIAFFAVFFFMSVSHFSGMAALLRQEVATLFLVLLTLLIVDKEIEIKKKGVLFVCFGVIMVVSHYLLSLLYMFYLMSAWIILMLLDRPSIQRIRDKIYVKLGIYKKEILAERTKPPKAAPRILNIVPIVLFIMFALVWYFITSSSTILDAYIKAFLTMAQSVTQFWNPETSHGLDVLLRAPKPGIFHTINAVINYLNPVFIIAGVFLLLLKYRDMKFTRVYAMFAFLSLALVSVGVVVPYFAMRLDMQRLYHIGLIFLAPFGILGCWLLLRTVGRLTKTILKKGVMGERAQSLLFSILSIYFVLFFLFESGLVWQTTEVYFGSVQLSQETIKKYGDPITKGFFYSSVTPKQDVFSARWLTSHIEPGARIFATYNDAQVHTLTSYGMFYSPGNPWLKVPPLSKVMDGLPPNDYLYLQYLNVVEGIVTEFDENALPGRTLSTYSSSEISQVYAAENKIYSNGGSEVYR